MQTRAFRPTLWAQRGHFRRRIKGCNWGEEEKWISTPKCASTVTPQLFSIGRDLTMKGVTRKTRTCLSLALGVLVFAGTCFVVGPALAQLDCPLPEGVTPPAAPRVTAQQVEDGSGSLTDFALAVRDHFVSESQGITAGEVTAGRAAYVRCLVRQEGSPWRSGSTHIVSLTPDGRVLLHAKNMSLSSRLLNPVIYGAILHALGINPASLTDPQPPRPPSPLPQPGMAGRSTSPMSRVPPATPPYISRPPCSARSCFSPDSRSVSLT